MAHQVVELECPGCGAALDTSSKVCPKCYRPIVITTLNSLSGFSGIDLNKQANAYRKALAKDPNNEDVNMSVGFCYLGLKMYDKAIEHFNKALESNFDNSELYYYTAIALLEGKKAFLAPRKTIDKIVELLNAAIMIENKGIYNYYLAYIKYDFFKRKFLNTTPDYQECFNNAIAVGLSIDDVNSLYQLLNVERPEVL